MEVTINKSYRLYTQTQGKNISALKFRQTIIKKWEEDYLRESKKERIKLEQAKTDPALQSESSKDGKLDDEDVCRLVLFDPKRDFDVC